MQIQLYQVFWRFTIDKTPRLTTCLVASVLERFVHAAGAVALKV